MSRKHNKTQKFNLLLTHKDTLKFLENAPKKLRNAVLSHCCKSFRKCIAEIALNIVNGNLNVRTDLMKKLAPHRNYLRRVAKRGQHTKKIIQKGGSVIPLLISALLSTGLSSILSK